MNMILYNFLKQATPSELFPLLLILEDKMQIRSKWESEIPFIQFPPDWEIRMIPAFFALLRFRAKRKTDKEYICVYLDGYDFLGFKEYPYWEVWHDYENGDNERFPMNDISGLINSIAQALEAKNK